MLLKLCFINEDVRQASTQLRSQCWQSQLLVQRLQFLSPLQVLQQMHLQKRLALGAGKVSFALIMVTFYILLV